MLQNVKVETLYLLVEENISYNSISATTYQFIFFSRNATTFFVMIFYSTDENLENTEKASDSINNKIHWVWLFTGLSFESI